MRSHIDCHGGAEDTTMAFTLGSTRFGRSGSDVTTVTVYDAIGGTVTVPVNDLLSFASYWREDKLLANKQRRPRPNDQTQYRKVLGDWGESHACRLLRLQGFKVTLLNIDGQHPGGDVLAERRGQRLLFSVKTRDRFGQNGRPNPGYNIFPQKVIESAKKLQATPAWLAIRVDRRDNTFCAYWGLIAEIPPGRISRNRVDVRMGEAEIATYRVLATDEKDPEIVNVFLGKAY
jgi:hypothetical protein